MCSFCVTDYFNPVQHKVVHTAFKIRIPPLVFLFFVHKKIFFEIIKFLSIKNIFFFIQNNLFSEKKLVSCYRFFIEEKILKKSLCFGLKKRNIPLISFEHRTCAVFFFQRCSETELLQKTNNILPRIK